MASASNSMRLQTHFGPDLRRRNCGSQVAHAHQIVGCASKGKHPVHLAHSTMSYFPQQRDRLQPPETFLDPLPFLLADAVTGMPRRAPINRTAAAPTVILRDMRRHPQMAALVHEVQVSKPLSPPTVSGCVPPSRSSITSAVSRSAVPLASQTSAFTISPLRFSTSRLPL